MKRSSHPTNTPLEAFVRHVCEIHSSLLRTTAFIAAGLCLETSPLLAAIPPLGLNHRQPWNETTQWTPFDTWLGQTVLYRNSFCSGQNPGDTWDEWDEGPWFMPATQAWLARSPNHVEVMALPLLPPSENGNFASVYNGTRAVHFANWAQKLIDAGVHNRVIVRLGWEFNQPKQGQPGNWFPWGCGNDEAGYAKAFHAAVVALRSKIPNLKIIWNPNCGGAENWQACWPTNNAGVPQDQDVDYVGIDAYDDSNWAGRLNNNPGLQEIRTFAAAKGKPECWPEWGLRANGDNPTYVQNMYKWMTSGTNIFYQAFWNDVCCDTLGIFNVTPVAPNSANLYKTLFGVAPPPVPPAPTGLSATSGQNAQVPLSWSASSGATSYRVYRGTTSNGQSTTPIATNITATIYTNIGLTNNATYYYKVKAVNSAGESGYSNEASATPLSTTPPLANGTYTLAPANASGMRLQVAAATPVNGTNVNIGTASSSSTAQRWTLTNLGGNTYWLENVASASTDQCLDVQGQLTASGTNIHSWQYLGQANQKWTLTPVSGGYTLAPTHATSMRLNATGTASGSNVNQLTANSSSAQTWNIVPVSSGSGNTHGGTWAMRGTPTNTPNNSNFWQVATGLPSGSASYKASIWIKGSGKCTLRVMSGSWGTQLTSTTVTATSTWTQVSTANFTKGSGVTSLTFSVTDSATGAAGTYYVDDVYLGPADGSSNKVINAGMESGTANWNPPLETPFTILQNP